MNKSALAFLRRLSLSSLLNFRGGLLLVAFLPLASEAVAATLKDQTVAAWNEYLQSADADLQDRIRAGGTFLWANENNAREARVHGGEIVIAPAPGQNPKKVPGGLIHHWKGSMFVPNAALDDVLRVTRDYDRYKEFFAPSVVDSKTMASNGADDYFSIVLMNKGLFLKSALDADYESKNVRVDGHRFYSVSKTTRVQEIQQYGRPEQHRLTEGQGGGYIWKLYSVSRLEEKDGGVFVEVEAIALSRDIPIAVRVMASPIVRRVSHNAILVSLQQTENAVRETTTLAKSSRVPVSDTPGRIRSAVLR